MSDVEIEVPNRKIMPSEEDRFGRQVNWQKLFLEYLAPIIVYEHRDYFLYIGSETDFHSESTDELVF